MFVCEPGICECDWDLVDGGKNEEGKIGVGSVNCIDGEKNDDWGCW